LFATIFSASFNIHRLWAQATGLGLKPAFLYDGDKVDPGTVIRRTIKATNNTGAAGTFRLSVRDIVGVAEESRPVFSTSSVQDGMASWVFLPTTPFSINDGETKEIMVEIRVPQDATPGSHFAGIFLSSDTGSANGIGSGIAYDVVSIINLQVSGDAKESLRIREFSTPKNVYGSPNVDFKIVLENDGNVLEKPRGPLEITNMFGRRVYETIVNDNEPPAGVFPGDKRTFTANWKGDGISFGRYQATVAMLYGYNTQKTIFGTISFWVLPMNVIIPGIILLIFVILGIVLSLKLYINSRLKGASSRATVASSSSLSRFVFIAVFALLFAAVFLLLLFFVLQ